jgi:predicted XRE-type DNA-binding protein
LSEIDFIPSRGNVFEDLGGPDAEERYAKALLSRLIDKTITERELTQVEAAELLGCAQPDISNVVRGKVGNYTIDRLTRFLVRLGYNVEIHVVEPGQAEDAHLLVTT